MSLGEVKPINNRQAYPFLLGIHYARRIPSISYAFGLHRDGELVGVVTYGSPPSAPYGVGCAVTSGLAAFLSLTVYASVTT